MLSQARGGRSIESSADVTLDSGYGRARYCGTFPPLLPPIRLFRVTSPPSLLSTVTFSGLAETAKVWRPTRPEAVVALAGKRGKSASDVVRENEERARNESEGRRRRQVRSHHTPSRMALSRHTAVERSNTDSDESNTPLMFFTATTVRPSLARGRDGWKNSPPPYP